MRSHLVFALALAVSGCSMESPKVSSRLAPGEYRLAMPGGRIWYRIVGTGTATPAVLLHGGPGLSSFYMKPLEALSDTRIVIRYDQLGGGKSDRISDTTLFTMDHFIQELDSLRAHLGIRKWHLVGHSWGSMLGLEYYRLHPDRVASLTLGSTVADVSAYARHAELLIHTLADSAQLAIATARATGVYDSPEYAAATQAFYALYLTRQPLVADLDSTLATVNEAIYQYLWGPSEFTVTGRLKNYDVTAFLPSVAVPTLLTVGEFDEVGPDLIRQVAARIPNARFIQFAGAAHLTTWDARTEMVQAIGDFLRSVDSTIARP